MPTTPTPTTLPSSGPDAQCPVPDASSPAWHPRALELLSAPSHSLLEIAEALSIPLHQLARFVLSHPGLEAATDIQAASIIHARTAAAASLPKVVSVLSQTLDDFLKTNACARASHEPGTLDPNTHDSAMHSTPSTETRHLRALRAAHLLVRLANFQPKPLQRPLHPILPPQGGGVAAAATEGASPTSTPSRSLLTTSAIREFKPSPALDTASPTHSPTPQSPRLQPGHKQPTPVEHAFADLHVSSAPDAPWASARDEEHRTSPLAGPSTHHHQPLSLPLMPDAQCLMPSPPLPTPYSPLPSLHPP